MERKNFTIINVEDDTFKRLGKVMTFTNALYDYAITDKPIGVIGVQFQIGVLNQLLDPVRL